METHINFYASEETAVFQKPTFEWVWKLRFFGVEGMERGLQLSQLIGLILEF